MKEPAKTLVLFFHPNPKTSVVGKALFKATANLPNVTARDMYAQYPDYLIDVKHEQQCVEQHEIIVFQHPVYWYSCPPLLKLWLDDVLEHNWAYGSLGTKLQGKTLLSAVTAGGAQNAYSPEGFNRQSLETFLKPFEQTASLCGMTYARPFIVYNSRGLSSDSLEQEVERYRTIIKTLSASESSP